MKDETKPDKNTLLIMLTMFDLLGAIAGPTPFIMMAKMTGEMEEASYKLLLSVPTVAVVLLIAAWMMDTQGKPKLARILAAIPLIWGMTVFVLLNAPNG